VGGGEGERERRLSGIIESDVPHPREKKRRRKKKEKKKEKKNKEREKENCEFNNDARQAARGKFALTRDNDA